MIASDRILVTLIIITGTLFSVLFKKLTLPAAFTGACLSFLIFTGSGYTGILMMATFFFTGVMVTAWKRELKQKEGLAEPQKGRRSSGQVWANAGLAALIAFIAQYLPAACINAPLIIAACFASATADTVSSELGNIYGKHFYNILNFKKAQKGLNGVISEAGTLLGLAGSLLIAVIYSAGYQWWPDAAIILAAGTAGNVADSILGAAFEQKGYISNNTVNFLSTCIAALTAWLIMQVV